MPQVGAAVTVADGEDAVRPEHNRVDDFACGVGEYGGDLARGDVPQVHAVVAVADGEVAVWPECDRVDALGCGSVSVAMSLPVVVRVLAGCSWETAAGTAGDRAPALGAEDGCMRGVGCCCWLSSSGAIRAR